MGTSLDREFRLAPPGSGRGVSCDTDGAFLANIPLLKRSEADSDWEPRDCVELSEQSSTEFGLPIDMSSKVGGLHAISRALNENDVARAQIATVLLGIPDYPSNLNETTSHCDLIKFVRDLYWTGLIKIGDEGDLQKAGYNPAEPRDEYGRWTCEDADAAHLDDGVYHPDSDPDVLDPIAGSPEQLLLNRLTHQLQVNKEMAKWRKWGFKVTPNVMFINPKTGTPVVVDYVVSQLVPDPFGWFLFRKPEPLWACDVKTGGGGLTDNQKEVYPHILAGGVVIPVGDNAAYAGFEVGEPTIVSELYVGRNLPSDTVH
jgi:hypothetical protein